jgi:tetratricopeptide (TPR) repeat protein
MNQAHLRRLIAAARGSALILALLASACRSSDTAVQRGDRFWADSNFTAALAEYRLAARQSSSDPGIVARVAHAYVKTGQLEQAKEEYARLLKFAPEYSDQAVFDFLALAQQAAARSDRFGLARAVEAAVEFRPGIDVGEWAPLLARYYASSGDADRALEYFERAIAVGGEDAAPRLFFEVANLHERQGACGDAMGYYRSYLARMPYGDSANDARFRLGSCAFDLGKKARDAGDQEKAVEYFTTVTDYGAPATLLDQAWFERGEALLSLGRTAEALDAFKHVLEHTPPGRESAISVRARKRIQELIGVLSRSGIGMHQTAPDIETAPFGRVYAGQP